MIQRQLPGQALQDIKDVLEEAGVQDLGFR
jgi:hypothetical protein